MEKNKLKPNLNQADISAITEAMTGLLDKQTVVLATKEELKDQTAELKAYANEGFETQQFWMEARFDELIEKYDVRDRVDKLEKDVKQLKFHNKTI